MPATKRRAGAATTTKRNTGGAKGRATAKKKPASRKKKEEGRLHELTGILMMALGLLFAVCLYSPYGGEFGAAVSYFCHGLFGWPANVIAVFLIGCGIYVMLRRDYNRMYIKLTLCLLGMINLSILFHLFGAPETELSLFDAFELANRAGIGGGLIGACIAMPLVPMLGKWICLIIFFTTLLILLIFLFKISPVRLIAGFVHTARREADEIQEERSYEMGKRARDAVDHVRTSAKHNLRPLVQKSIDIDVTPDDTAQHKQKKAKKVHDASVALQAPADESISDLPFMQPDAADFNVPVFDATAVDVSSVQETEELLSADDLAEGDVTFSKEAAMMDDMTPDQPEKAVVKPEKLTKQEEDVLKSQLEEGVKSVPIPYKYPSTTLLSPPSAKKATDSREELRETAMKLVDTLKSFGVDVKLLQVSRGPTVTRYELQPSIGVKVSKITSLADDIALNLAASAVRIEAPIPGKAAIGIEVPNKDIASVALRDVIESPEFRNAKSKLSVAMGLDITGKPIIANIAKMPHVLIAGATGSGKSVCINSIITSLLYKADPNEVKLIMVDPKVVELGVYNGIPHLLIPVVTDPKKATGALAWAVSEMVRRYNLFAENGVRDLEGYNAVLELDGEDKLPQMVIIIDELSDLMMVAPKEIEDSICRLAQMARAAGMHLIIATQRPSVNVITGVIKANIPSRIAFAVSSQIDSRTILDTAGAEKLLGRGDMLFMPMGASKPIRLQGAFISDKEVERVVEFIKDTSVAKYDEDIKEKINASTEIDTDAGDCDELLSKAIEIAVSTGSISTSMVQRRLGVGYARAGRIIDQMEARGIISGADGSKPRNVLISQEDLQ